MKDYEWYIVDFCENCLFIRINVISRLETCMYMTGSTCWKTVTVATVFAKMAASMREMCNISEKPQSPYLNNIWYRILCHKLSIQTTFIENNLNFQKSM